ncbi:MAG: hypothetical protein AAFR16_10260 [Pseudomonadota bacterium]
MRTAILAAVAGGLVAVSAFEAAAQSTPRVDQRQQNQLSRIHDGVADGALRPGETRQLLRGQARVARKERRFKSDGVVTPSERARLARSQNRQSRRIFRKKTNGY